MNELLRSPLPEEIDFRRQMLRLQEMSRLSKETEVWQSHVDAHIDTDDPFVFLQPLSDLHLGHKGVDMEALAEHLRFLGDRDAYTILCGDIGDFFLPGKHPDGMMGDVLEPDDQMILMRGFMEQFADKILAVVQDPSHVDWVRQSSGIEAYRWATRGLGIPMLESGGTVTLTANDQRYEILAFHEISRYKSSFNRTHAHKRARELHKEADIVLAGHTHIGAMEKAVHREDKPYFVQLGTFKTQDGYGTRKGMFPKPQVFFPTLLLDTHKHNIEAIEDLETAEMVYDMCDAHMRLT